jgi:hypothetical protein
VRSGLARARRQAGSGPREEERGRGRGGGSRGFGPRVGPAGGGGGFSLFSFYSLIPISHFVSFPLEQIIL